MNQTERDADPSALQVGATSRPDAAWDRLAEEAPGGTYCHLAGWHTIITEVLGHEAHYLEARDSSGGLEGILPLVRVRSLLFGDYLVSMPFLNYGGPVGTPEACRVLTGEALELADRRGVDLMELRCRSREQLSSDHVREEDGEGDAGTPGHGLVVTGRKITVVLPLPDEVEELWKGTLRSKVRSQVRKPMKEGLEARIGPEQAEPFYEVFAENMRDLGTPVLPVELFRALPRVFDDRVVFCVVYREDEPVAGGCGFFCGDEFEITWASALREHSRVAPNMLLYWEMMKHALETGARAFNFGRCTPDGGSHRFKSQWGGHDEPLPWTAWAPDGAVETPNPDQGKYALAVSLWQKLPLPLTRVLGPPLARRIP